jgi:UDP-N-acetylmuramyl pentapeptide phosphotransferase/UDP-N-acetylglucosamine-1-phosphate transferase
MPMLVLIAFGLLGMRDDLDGIKGKNGQGNGLRARLKASLQIILAIAVVLAIAYIYATLSFYYGFKNWRPV